MPDDDARDVVTSIAREVAHAVAAVPAPDGHPKIPALVEQRAEAVRDAA